MASCRVPIVAAVNGPAVGLGCSLVALSDIVFIAESAYLADPHVALGLVAADGGPITWPLLTSLHLVKEYALTGDRIPAARAAEIGLANHVCPDGEVLEQAIACAETDRETAAPGGRRHQARHQPPLAARRFWPPSTSRSRPRTVPSARPSFAPTSIVSSPVPTQRNREVDVTLKIDVQLSNSVVEAAERARALEQIGVDGVFSFENSHDVFFPLVAAAPVCSLDLMTNVAMAFPRSPLHMAHAAYDLQLLSKGRFRLGIGSQVRAHIEKRYGAQWGAPVAHMRESVEATKAILRSWQDGTRVKYRGEYTTHTLSTPAFTPPPNPYGVPKVLVGALGPKMNRMAAEVADGALVMPFNTERHMRQRTWPAINAGLEAAGRRGAPTSRSPWRCSSASGATTRSSKLRRGVRTTLSFYGSTPSYRGVLEVEGWGELQPELNVAVETRGLGGDGEARDRRDGRHTRRARHSRRGRGRDCEALRGLRPHLRLLSGLSSRRRPHRRLRRRREGRVTPVAIPIEVTSDVRIGVVAAGDVWATRELEARGSTRCGWAATSHHRTRARRR